MSGALRTGRTCPLLQVTIISDFGARWLKREPIVLRKSLQAQSTSHNKSCSASNFLGTFLLRLSSHPRHFWWCFVRAVVKIIDRTLGT